MPHPARFTNVLFALFLLLSTLAPLSARADDAQPIQDNVTLELRAETWITTARALVQVNIVAAGDAANAATIREEIAKALNELVSDTKWRPVSLNRSQDEAGLERWYATYEGRIPESQLAGLADKAKKSSRAGLQFTIAGVQFTPEMKEVEAARSALRVDIYKQVQEELNKLNQAFPGRDFRVAGVQFSAAGQSPVMPMMAGRAQMKTMMMNAQMAEMAADSGASYDMGVETKMEMTAFVTYSSNAPHPAE